MTAKDVFNILKKDVKFTRHMECLEAGYGCELGQNYTEDCIVVRGVRWVRRINDDPPRYKTVTIETNFENRKGYFDIDSSYLNRCDIEQIDNGFILMQKKEYSKYDLGTWKETYTLK